MASDDSGIESHSSPEMISSEAPVSRTHQYRSVVKPLLERKRRARINKCLDELKDLMVVALQTEGESISKLEKADVLELTVRHLRKLKAQGALILGNSSLHGGDSHRAGYSFCVSQVSQWVTAGHQGIDLVVSARLLHHLAQIIRSLESSGFGAAARPPDPRIPQLFESRTHPHAMDFTPSTFGSWSALPSSLLSLPLNSEMRNSRRRSESLVSPFPPRSDSPVSSVPPRSDSPVSSILSLGENSENDSAWRPW